MQQPLMGAILFTSTGQCFTDAAADGTDGRSEPIKEIYNDSACCTTNLEPEGRKESLLMLGQQFMKDGYAMCVLCFTLIKLFPRH
jgi:hypothetical protein